jgi:hypothetical protein
MFMTEGLRTMWADMNGFLSGSGTEIGQMSDALSARAEAYAATRPAPGMHISPGFSPYPDYATKGRTLADEVHMNMRRLAQSWRALRALCVRDRYKDIVDMSRALSSASWLSRDLADRAQQALSGDSRMPPTDRDLLSVLYMDTPLLRQSWMLTEKLNTRIGIRKVVTEPGCVRVEMKNGDQLLGFQVAHACHPPVVSSPAASVPAVPIPVAPAQRSTVLAKPSSNVCVLFPDGPGDGFILDEIRERARRRCRRPRAFTEAETGPSTGATILTLAREPV